MARRKPRHVATKSRTRSNKDPSSSSETFPSKDSIKAAEDLALTAFASGLKLAAAFGTVAAKTTSLALASIATGADKFSELVKQEAMKSAASHSRSNSSRNGSRRRRAKNRANVMTQ